MTSNNISFEYLIEYKNYNSQKQELGRNNTYLKTNPVTNEMLIWLLF